MLFWAAKIGSQQAKRTLKCKYERVYFIQYHLERLRFYLLDVHVTHILKKEDSVGMNVRILRREPVSKNLKSHYSLTL